MNDKVPASFWVGWGLVAAAAAGLFLGTLAIRGKRS